MKSNLVHLEFMGQRIAVKAQGDQVLLKEAIELASLKLKDVEKRSKTPAVHQVALLALLEVCEEYVRAKHRAAEVRGKFIDKARILIDLAKPEQKSTGA